MPRALSTASACRSDMTTLGIHGVDDECFKRSRCRAGTCKRRLCHPEQMSTCQPLRITELSPLGIDSPRATLAAVKVARAAAALKLEQAVEEEEVALALRLCLLPRAQQIPEMAEPAPEPDA